MIDLKDLKKRTLIKRTRLSVQNGGTVEDVWIEREAVEDVWIKTRM
jgi:hypothetical protein